MTQSITVDGISRGTGITRDRVEWVESAYLGEVGSGHFVLEDASGTASMPGHKTIIVTQDAGGTAITDRLFTGFVGNKTISRGETSYIGASREIDVQTRDLNDLLTRFVIYDTDGKRDAETVTERVSWLLSSDYLSGLVSDFGAVASADGVGMDKVDYRGQRAGDVLAACAKAASYNYYVRWHPGSAAPELVFRDDNASTADTSTITISNVAAETNGTSVFAPNQEAKLNVQVEDVYSGAYFTYSKGAGYTTRAATGTAFVERDGVTEDSGITTMATAELAAERFLWDSHLEEHMIEVTLRMRAAYVNLVLPGQRIQAKFTHFDTEGYGSPTWFRVLRRRITQPLNTDEDYDVALDLSPQEDAPPEGTIVQKVSARSGEGGVTLTLPNPVTVGNMLVLVCGDRGSPNPPAPNTSVNLPRFGADAWTKAPNTTNIDGGSGVAIWYKVADSTSRTGYVGQSGSNMVLYEVAGVTATGLATLDESLQANNLTMSLGSLGTVTDGAVVFSVILWSDQRYASSPGMPVVTPATGFVTDRFDSAYEGGAIAENAPFVWIGHAFGDGSALSPGITRSAAAVLSGIWAGVALVLEPA